MMAMLAGLLMDAKDTGKEENRQVAKSQIVLIIILVKKVYRTIAHPWLHRHRKQIESGVAILIFMSLTIIFIHFKLYY